MVGHPDGQVVSHQVREGDRSVFGDLSGQVGGVDTPEVRVSQLHVDGI